MKPFLFLFLMITAALFVNGCLGSGVQAQDSGVQTITADYYYFTIPNCAACKKQTPIVKKLNKQGYDFKIREWGYRDFNITSFPAFVVEVKENGIPAVTVKMENRIWTSFQLKTLVRTVNMLIRLS